MQALCRVMRNVFNTLASVVRQPIGGKHVYGPPCLLSESTAQEYIGRGPVLTGDVPVVGKDLDSWLIRSR